MVQHMTEKAIQEEPKEFIPGKGLVPQSLAGAYRKAIARDDEHLKAMAEWAVECWLEEDKYNPTHLFSAVDKTSDKNEIPRDADGENELGIIENQADK